MLVNIGFVSTYLFFNNFVCCQQYAQHPYMEDDVLRTRKNYNRPYPDYGPLDMEDMFKKITQYNKWDEFYERYNRDMESLQGASVMKNWEENARDWKRWVQKITDENTVQRAGKPKYFPETDQERKWASPSIGQYLPESNQGRKWESPVGQYQPETNRGRKWDTRASIGMDMYWRDEDEPQYLPESNQGRKWESPVGQYQPETNRGRKWDTRASIGMDMYWRDEDEPAPPKRKSRPMPPEQAKALAYQRLMQIQYNMQAKLSPLRQAVEEQNALRARLENNIQPMKEEPLPRNPLQQLSFPDLIENVNSNLGINDSPMPNPPRQQFQNNIPNPPSMVAITAPQKNFAYQKVAAPIIKPAMKTSSNVPLVFPEMDDLGSPIRWVNYNSPETNDGLAKVTDQSTGKNKQFVINGTVYVPIIDHDPARFGLTTVRPAPAIQINKNESILRTVLTNIDFRNSTTGDWLAYSIINADTDHDNECGEDGCEARCFSSGCQTRCSGDTCKVGCVGESCAAVCHGPGCKAMCIGERCTSQCDGMSCDSRCRGNECVATCKKLSCGYTVNDIANIGTDSWNDLYPQYNTRLDNSYNY